MNLHGPYVTIFGNNGGKEKQISLNILFFFAYQNLDARWKEEPIYIYTYVFDN